MITSFDDKGLARRIQRLNPQRYYGISAAAAFEALLYQIRVLG